MKRTSAIAFIAIAVFLLCAFSACTAETPAEGYTFVDGNGKETTVPYSPQRVVSLQGSFAETWLVAGGSLVGVTDDAVDDLSLDVGDAALLGTVKQPDTETLLSLDPDFVIMSSDIAGHKDVATLLDSVGIPYAFFRQETFDDYLAMLDVFTTLTGKRENYEKYGNALKVRIDDVVARAGAVQDKPEVLFVRARSQGVSAKAYDHTVCTILEDLGIVNIAAKYPSLLENLSLEEIIIQDPDFILVTFMGDEENAKNYLVKEWESNPAWNGLSAVKQHGYVFLQKDLYHFKPNARWADAYETLFEILFG